MTQIPAEETLIEYPRTAGPEEWLHARAKLLAEEKELTKARDRLTAKRRELPMVRVDRGYTFEGPEGSCTLRELFRDRLQLIVYHFMWRWEKGQPLEDPCKGCAGFADELGRGVFNVLGSRNSRFILVSRAPLPTIEAFKRRMGWNIPWYSSAGTTFNFDFGVSLDPAVQPMRYNFKSREEHEAAGTGYYFSDEPPFDLPGLSTFLRRGADVYHTYSTYGRGLEEAIASNRLLDYTALGRQEGWEKPKERAAGLIAQPGPPALFPDEYARRR